MNRKRSALRAESFALWAVPALALVGGLFLGLRPNITPDPAEAPPGAPADRPVWERAAAAHDKAEIAAIVEEIGGLPEPTRGRWRRLAFARWVQIDPEGALGAVWASGDPDAGADLVREWTLGDPEAAWAALGGEFAQEPRPVWAGDFVRALAESDPARYFAEGLGTGVGARYFRSAALALAEENREAALAVAEGFGDDDSGRLAREIVESAVAQAWGAADPEAAARWAAGAGEPGRRRALAAWAICGAATAEPHEAAVQLAALGEGGEPRVDRPWRQDNLEARAFPDPYAVVGVALVRSDPAALADLLDQLPGDGAVRALRGAIEGVPGSVEPAELAGMLDKIAKAEVASDLAAWLVGSWAGGDADVFARAAAGLPPSPGRDALFAAAVARWVSRDAAAAADFLRGFPEPALRAHAGELALGQPDPWFQARDVLGVIAASGAGSIPFLQRASLLPPAEVHEVAEAAEQLGDGGAAGEIVVSWVRGAPGDAVRWAVEGPQSRRTSRLRLVFGAWTDRAPDLARAAFDGLDLPPDVRTAIEEGVEW